MSTTTKGKKRSRNTEGDGPKRPKIAKRRKKDEPDPKPWTFYMCTNHDGSGTYTGISNNPTRRLKEHKGGRKKRGANTTSKWDGDCQMVIRVGPLLNRSDATSLECYTKDKFRTRMKLAPLYNAWRKTKIPRLRELRESKDGEAKEESQVDSSEVKRKRRSTTSGFQGLELTNAEKRAMQIAHVLSIPRWRQRNFTVVCERPELTQILALRDKFIIMDSKEAPTAKVVRPAEAQSTDEPTESPEQEPPSEQERREEPMGEKSETTGAP